MCVPINDSQLATAYTYYVYDVASTHVTIYTSHCVGYLWPKSSSQGEGTGVIQAQGKHRETMQNSHTLCA